MWDASAWDNVDEFEIREEGPLVPRREGVVSVIGIDFKMAV